MEVYGMKDVIMLKPAQPLKPTALIYVQLQYSYSLPNDNEAMHFPSCNLCYSIGAI